MAEAPGSDFITRESAQHMQHVASIYGSHLPFRLLMERNLAAAEKRLAGLPSSHLSLEILASREVDLPFPAYIQPEILDVMPKVEKKTQWLE